MNKVTARFPGRLYEYTFKTNLPLRTGCTYQIECGDWTYTSPVIIVRYTKDSPDGIALKTITKATLVEMPQKLIDKVKNVYFNEEKRTTVVVWNDGVKTKVKCGPGDTYNREAGLALCVMKRAFGNDGSYNELLKKYCYSYED